MSPNELFLQKNHGFYRTMFDLKNCHFLNIDFNVIKNRCSQQLFAGYETLDPIDDTL